MQTIQEIFNNTNNLYNLNNIEINSIKSDLLHIQSKSKIPKLLTSKVLYFNNQTISLRKPEETIRYLGIFYDENGTSKPTFETIFNKIENFFSLIKYKKLTSSQITSLFNLILQPALEYLFQIVQIHKNIQTKLSRLFTIQTKKLLSLAKNTNNIILTNSLSFNFLILNNIIQKVSTSNIERIFTSNLLLKNIGISRIKSWLTKI